MVASDNETSEKKDTQQEASTKKTFRAKSLAELQRRLDVITNKPKTGLSYKEKMKKKNLKKLIKKKDRQIARGQTKQDQNRLQKQLKNDAQTLQEGTPEENQTAKSDKPSAEPIFNAGEKVVFSKFDLSGIGKQKAKKVESNPKKALDKLKQKKEKLKKLEESGQTQAAVEMKRKDAWKNALAKAEGLKVKDDELLLKKSIKSKELLKKRSAKKWESRIQGVANAKEDRQKKRQENIDKKKKEKKVRKNKLASKRGKIIPGF